MEGGRHIVVANRFLFFKFDLVENGQPWVFYVTPDFWGVSYFTLYINCPLFREAFSALSSQDSLHIQTWGLNQNQNFNSCSHCIVFKGWIHLSIYFCHCCSVRSTCLVWYKVMQSELVLEQTSSHSHLQLGRLVYLCCSVLYVYSRDFRWMSWRANWDIFQIHRGSLTKLWIVL